MDGKYRCFKVRQDGGASVVTLNISEYSKPNKAKQHCSLSSSTVDGVQAHPNQRLKARGE